MGSEVTLMKAHELKERDESHGNQLASLGAAGSAVQLHLDYPVLDGHLRNQGALHIPSQRSIFIGTLQWTCVLLVAHFHLWEQQCMLPQQ